MVSERGLEWWWKCGKEGRAAAAAADPLPTVRVCLERRWFWKGAGRSRAGWSDVGCGQGMVIGEGCTEGGMMKEEETNSVGGGLDLGGLSSRTRAAGPGQRDTIEG